VRTKRLVQPQQQALYQFTSINQQLASGEGVAKIAAAANGRATFHQGSWNFGNLFAVTPAQLLANQLPTRRVDLTMALHRRVDA
jgi:hypothetical protein